MIDPTLERLSDDRTPWPRGVDRELIAHAILACAKASRFDGPDEVAGTVALRELCYPGWYSGHRWPAAALAALESGVDAAINAWLDKQSGEWLTERQGEVLRGAAEVAVLHLAKAMAVGLRPGFRHERLLPVVALLGPELQALDVVRPIDRAPIHPGVVVATWPDCTTRADECDDRESLAKALQRR